MNIVDIKNSILKSFSVFSFEYESKIGGIDPMSNTEFVLWYGNDKNLTVNSIEKAVNTPIFNDKSLTELLNENLITKENFIEYNF